jgi:alpha-amylase
MTPICLVLRAHEPWRLRRYNYFDVGRRHDYFDAETSRRRLLRFEELSLSPAVEMLERLLARHPRFAFAIAFSGPFLDQLEIVSPARVAGLRRLVESGRVEPLSATSHRRLPWPISSRELLRQVRADRTRVGRRLGVVPRVFGTERVADLEALAGALEAEGFAGLVFRSSSALPSGEARRRLHRATEHHALPVLVDEDRLSDDLGRRFSDRRWASWPLSAAKFDGWISATPGDILCLLIDVGAFGQTHRRESGIFEFFEEWVGLALDRADQRFLTPSQAVAQRPEFPLPTLPAKSVAPPVINVLQQDVLTELIALEPLLEAGEPAAAEDLRRLASDDTLSAMTLRASGAASTRDGAFDSPYEAYMALRHALTDVGRRLAGPSADRSIFASASPA